MSKRSAAISQDELMPDGERELQPALDVYHLGPEDIDSRGLSPAKDLVARVAERVVRRGKTSSPGYFIIANTRQMLGTRSRVIEFQRQLMYGLKLFLLEEMPTAVEPQKYLSLPPEAADVFYRSDSLGTEAFQFSGFGMASNKDFHFDNLRHSYVSLCYGPYRNIVGGKPRLCDALRIRDILQLADIRDVVDLYTMRMIYTELHTIVDLEGSVKPEFNHLISECTITYEEFDATQMPLLIFSNRLEDGLLHGATAVSARKDGKLSSRPLSYCSIKHFPFVKRGPFDKQHIVRI